MCVCVRGGWWVSHSVYYKERVGRLSQWSAVILDRGLFSGNVRGQCVIRVHQNELGEVRRVRRGQAALSSSSLLLSVPPGRSFDASAFSKVVLGLSRRRPRACCRCLSGRRSWGPSRARLEGAGGGGCGTAGRRAGRIPACLAPGGPRSPGRQRKEFVGSQGGFHKSHCFSFCPNGTDVLGDEHTTF